MNITLTDRAIEEMNKKIGVQKGFLKIQYVTEGCACDSGVPTLWFVPTIDDQTDLLFETNDRPVVIEKSTLIYFDEELKIDFSDTTRTFKLNSPQQIVNAQMSFLMIN